jgi:CheY-like chemotaxis protein
MAKEALHIIRSERLDLVLLDMLMPKLHGLDVMRALKTEERTQSIPVLVLSNSSREQDVQAIMELGAVGYLVKTNLSLQELGDRVAELLGD